MKFYLAREGVAFGPYTAFQVRESIRLGIFERNDLALAEDGKEWSTVEQLLSVTADTKSGTDQPLVAPELVELPAIAAGLPSRAGQRLVRRLAWAAPVVLTFCVALGWMMFRPRPTARQPAAAQTVAGKVPASLVQPEPSLHPPTDDAALPARENIPGTQTQASTVANPQMPPASAPQNASSTTETPKISDAQHLIDGQISIAARNGRSYEPSAVEVRLYPIALLKPYLEKRALEANAKYDELGDKLKMAEAEKENLRKISNAAFDAYSTSAHDAPNRHDLELASAEAKNAREKATNEYYSLRQEREDILSGAFYLENLPPSASVTQTNSQGKFQLIAPDDGEFAVVAGTLREGEPIERYYWFIPVSLTAETGKTILLSNINTTAHGSTESLVQTID